MMYAAYVGAQTQKKPQQTYKINTIGQTGKRQ